MSSAKDVKNRLRKLIWDILEERNIARFPRPVHGRIPNFVGAESAASKLASTDIFRNASTIKVNPDSPQQPVRYLALKAGKKLVMPTPRLKEGFLLLDPSEIPKHMLKHASTIRGAFKLGRKIRLNEIPRVDLIVVGSVAVDKYGGRLGKGEGYSEIEYAILKELNKVDDDTPIATTVHDIQVLDTVIPKEPWDVPVDYIFTPIKSLRTIGIKSRPQGIIWDKLNKKKLSEIPVLREIRRPR
jgi:5-formyltetrahydrofolate cyclo-ligase